MCGIAGVFNLDGAPVSKDDLTAMTRAIAHRGPDGEGLYTDRHVGLGHRRLAIIDLSEGGAQPMHTGDGRYTITYNGELYNYVELRKELQQTGRTFVSHSDTEVLLKSIAAWGPEAALRRFNGMYAFAIYDKFARRLVIARDRFGVKPLYYAMCGKTLLFGSEIKALIAHPAYRSEIDPEALVEYLTFQNFFDDRTLFKGVKLLPAGTFAELGLLGDSRFPEGGIRVTRYWDFDFQEPERPGLEWVPGLQAAERRHEDAGNHVRQHECNEGLPHREFLFRPLDHLVPISSRSTNPSENNGR